MQLTVSGLVTLLLAVPLFAASAYVPAAAPVGVAWMALVVVAGVVDALVTRAGARFELARRVEPRLSLGAENRVRLHVRSRCGRSLRLQIKDSPPVEFCTPQRMREVLVAPFAEVEAWYVTVPPRRGDFTFGDIYVRGRGRLGVVTWQVRVPARAAVKVYPDLQEVGRYELLTRTHRLQEAGFHTLRERGEGTQFESLREYVPDDEFGDVDWKATARRGRPITRQYEVERSQNLILMLDAGRMMTAEVQGMSKLDYAINAALLLAHVACASDDAVGMIAFGREVHSYVPPRKGRAHVGLLLEQLYALQPTLEEPDYRAAFSVLSQRARKRALVVIFTDLVDREASQRLLSHVAALRPRYLPLLVTIRDSDLERAAAQFPRDLAAVYQRAVATQVLTARDSALAWMRSRGALVLDVPAGKLTVAAVNEYLRLKSSGRL